MKRFNMISFIFVVIILVSVWIFYPRDIDIQEWEKEKQIPNVSNQQLESWGYKSLNIQGDKAYKRKMKIAVIDSGIDKTHPDIKGIVTKEYNAINHNEEIVDDTGHGTAVAGIIGAKNNEIGIRGVVDSGNLEIYSIKAFEKNSSNEQIIKKALRWSIDQNVDIINFSAGVSKANLELEELITEAVNNNIIIISAAGNKFNSKVQFPADQPNVISVGAINNEYMQLSGTVITDVDFVGPGINILTTFPGNTYNYLGYTSSSTAFVTGIASNLLSEYLDRSQYNFDEILSVLRSNAKVIRVSDGTKIYVIQNSER